jgi:hypothetical protein
MKTLATATRLGRLLLLATLSLSAAPVLAEERWVTSIHSSQEWAVFPCKSYLITNVCGTDKDYSDPGSLPPIISVGDTISYTNKRGERKEFVVRYISFFVYDKDVDFTYGGRRLTAKKGDTTCSLYDTRTRSATRDTDYPSKVVIKRCRAIR